MSTVHWWLAILALGLALVTAGVAGVAWLTGRSARVLLDRLILVQLGVLLPTILLGLAMGLVEGFPNDPLHLLYGAVVFLPLPLARYLGRTGSQRRRAGYLALGALTTIGVIVRLFQTGG